MEGQNNKDHKSFEKNFSENNVQQYSILNKKNNSDLNNIKFINHIKINANFAFIKNDLFCLFYSVDNILCIIFQNKNHSIVTYNLIDNKIINEIKNQLKYKIKHFKHYQDTNKKIDLIMVISRNNLQVWNINNLKVLLDIKIINKLGFISSGTFLKENDKIFIVICNDSNEYLF